MRPIPLSVVIPVYQGEKTLPPLVDDLSRFFTPTRTASGHTVVVEEVLLVHDCGPDRSDLAIQALADAHPRVKPVWLSKNFGQHPATLAGMSSAMGEWIVTMDEDGQHAPDEMLTLVDHALEADLQVVYARPSAGLPHNMGRNISSRLSKRILSLLMGNEAVKDFNSFRVIRGDTGRALAAYCGNGVYLDVALLWVADRVGSRGVSLRRDDRSSGYSLMRLISHFWQMLVTSGPGLLRLVSLLGVFSIVVALLLTVYSLYGKFVTGVPLQGWTSLIIAVSFFSGCILLSLGVIAEYLAASLGIVMGKPLYVIGSRSNRSKGR